jgi:hypothetical protein
MGQPSAPPLLPEPLRLEVVHVKRYWQFVPASLLAAAILVGPWVGKWQEARQTREPAAVAAGDGADPSVDEQRPPRVYALTRAGAAVNAPDYGQIPDAWGTAGHVYFSPTARTYLVRSAVGGLPTWRIGRSPTGPTLYFNTCAATDPDPPLTADAAWQVSGGASPAPTVALAAPTPTPGLPPPGRSTARKLPLFPPGRGG